MKRCSLKKLLTLALLSVPALAGQWECKATDKCSTTALDDPAVAFVISGSGPNGRVVGIASVRDRIVIDDEKTSSSFIWMSLDDAKPIRVLVLISDSAATVFDPVASQLLAKLRTTKTIGVGFHAKESGFKAVRFDVSGMPALK